jgi:inorganic pyrophosphatase
MEETHIVYILSNKIIQEVTVVSCKLKGLLYNNDDDDDDNTFYEY